MGEATGSGRGPGFLILALVILGLLVVGFWVRGVPGGNGPPFSTFGWKTNFEKHTIPYSEILSGGPPKDGIPSVDNPSFVSAEEANAWLRDSEPVVSVFINREAKAYPLQILTWHEIVNDAVAGVPVSVTFCPLCNSAIAFDRRLEGQVLDFGTTGKLRRSDLVMYDRQTETWWQQLTGEAIVGDLVGLNLKMLPAPLIGYGQFKEAYPDGLVLSRETGHSRAYGQNPYAGYDDINSSPFLFRGPIDGRLPAMERVVAVSLDGKDRTYPFSVLEKVMVVNDRIGSRDVAVFHTPGASSALDRRSIADSRDVGATGVFDRHLEGELLEFFAKDGKIRDRKTGSVWDIVGRAVEGPLQGKTLEPLVHANHFAFAWLAFKPEAEVYLPEDTPL